MQRAPSKFLGHTSPTKFPLLLFLPLATFLLRARSRRARAMLARRPSDRSRPFDRSGCGLLIEALGGGWDASQLPQTTTSADVAPNVPSFAKLR